MPVAYIIVLSYLFILRQQFCQYNATYYIYKVFVWS